MSQQLIKILNTEIKNGSQLIWTKIKDHKKKIIFGLVLIFIGYVAKKKLTMMHIFMFINRISQILQYLPLPQSPNLRKIAQYQRLKLKPLSQIVQSIGLNDLKVRIKNKQSTMDELKHSIIAGVSLTFVLYNIQEFYFTVQNKYSEQFLKLEASTQYDKAMYNIRKRFVDDIPLMIDIINREVIFSEVSKLTLDKKVNIQTIESIFTQIQQKIFEKKINIEGLVFKSSVKSINQQASNYFFTHYELKNNKKKSKISTFTNKLSSVLGGISKFLWIPGWIPSPEVVVTNERYSIIKNLYILSLKKANIEISWPNRTSQQLFNLIIEQIEQVIYSLNFSIMLRKFSEYNKKIFVNRIKLYYQKQKKSQIMLSSLLPIIYKILKQQFFNSNQEELRQKYYQQEIKRCIKIQNSKIQDIIDENVCIEEEILKQIILKNQLQHITKQFELKYFNERSGLIFKPKVNEKQGKREADEIQKLLSMLGGSEELNSQKD